MKNPYLPLLDRITEKLIGHDDLYAHARSFREDIFEHWVKDNEWIHAFAANYAAALAFSFANPESRWAGNPRVLSAAEKIISSVVEAGIGDRWYHGGAGMGDTNIDRFTAVPLTEAVRLMGDKLPRETLEQALEKIDSVLRVQVEEYGNKQKSLYPNMDACYCVMMKLGHGLLGREEYLREHLRFLTRLEKAQFEDGGWTYIDGTNECPGYHDMNVLLLGRLTLLPGPERARAMLGKSAPYYPQTVSSCGLAEYYTDPWWKHSWKNLRSFGPDAVSSITGDEKNRYIGDMVRSRTENNLISGYTDNTSLLFLVYSAMLWRDVKADPVEENIIFHDRNIEGPRGRFPGWSWAATARYGCDTTVGAMANYCGEGRFSALLGIRPEILRRPDGGEDRANDRRSLGMIPRDCAIKTSIESDTAFFEAAYSMADHRAIWGVEPFPLAWECRQSWRLSPGSLDGRIEIISLKKQKSDLPVVRIRWGNYGRVEENGAGEFSYGPFLCRVKGKDFPRKAIQKSKTMPCRKEEDAWEIVLSTGETKRLCDEGLSFSVDIRIEFKERKINET